MQRQKAIARFLDGRLMKAYVIDFSPSDEVVTLEDEALRSQKILVNDLKAIFFVRSFEGNRGHSEKKTFVWPSTTGKRVFVKFKDGEYMTGHTDGDVPWDKGFFLEPPKAKGFFLIPVDDSSNNLKVFVVANAVWDVTLLG
jgi:hypothetical protein